MNNERYTKVLKQQHEDLKAVLEHYPIATQSIKLVSTRDGRSKWLVNTDKGPMYLRQEYIDPKRMLFIAGAHWHLQKNGLPIARLIQTKNGAICLSGGDHTYLLYEAHEGETMFYYDKTQVLKAMRFIGQFHQASQGYEAPEGSKSRSRAGKWQKLYRWKLQELESNKRLAEYDPTDPFSQLFLKEVGGMLQRGYEALHECEQPDFIHWTREIIESKVFCQQDFTMARMILEDGDAFMSDLHSITLDRPSRDLRVFLNKVMKKLAVWDNQFVIDMLRAYDQVHPLTRDQYKALWTDLKFPHLFSAITHKYYLGQKKSWSDEKYLMNLRKIVAVEQSKEDFLNNPDQWIDKIKEGGS